MEGVEDIPGTALAEGIRWAWETFPEFLDAVDAIALALDVGAQVPHGAVRAYVMGERGARNEPATADDIDAMARIVAEAIDAGAVGVSTSRTIVHRAIDGEPVPGTFAAEDELFALGQRARATSAAASSSSRPPGSRARTCRRPTGSSTGCAGWRRRPAGPSRTGSCSTTSRPTTGSGCSTSPARRSTDDVPLRPQVVGPADRAAARAADLPPAEQPADLRRARGAAARRAGRAPARSRRYASRILARATGGRDARVHRAWASTASSSSATRPNYEPAPDASVAARVPRARRRPRRRCSTTCCSNATAASCCCGRCSATATSPSSRCARCSTHPASVARHRRRRRARARDLRREQSDVHAHALGARPQPRAAPAARDGGAQDDGEQRGALRPRRPGQRSRSGKKADLNVIDLDRLQLHAPEFVHDLPGGAGRLVQRAERLPGHDRERRDHPARRGRHRRPSRQARAVGHHDATPATHRRPIDRAERAVVRAMRVPVYRYTVARVRRAREAERLWPRVWQIACTVDHVARAGRLLRVPRRAVLGADRARRRRRAARVPERVPPPRQPPVPGRGRRASPSCGARATGGHGTSRASCARCRRASGSARSRNDDFPLFPVRVDAWGPLVFVNLDPDAPPLARVPRGRARRHRVGRPRRVPLRGDHADRVACNWKVVADGFGETYHVQGLHREMLGSIDDINTPQRLWDHHGVSYQRVRRRRARVSARRATTRSCGTRSSRPRAGAWARRTRSRARRRRCRTGRPCAT